SRDATSHREHAHRAVARAALRQAQALPPRNQQDSAQGTRSGTKQSSGSVFLLTEPAANLLFEETSNSDRDICDYPAALGAEGRCWGKSSTSGRDTDPAERQFFLGW